MKKIALLLAGFAVVVAALQMEGATLPAGFTESPYGGGVGTSPTAMEFAPVDAQGNVRLFVCLQGGQLMVIKNGTLLPNAFVTLPVNSFGERGLLGIAFDPAYATNRFVYLYYTTNSPAVHNRVSRFTADATGDQAVAGSEVVLMDLDNLSTATNHNGGATHFGPDGKLYLAVGENANPANAQSIGNRLGKILRINPDGTIPMDNPASFPGIAGMTMGNNRAIWAVGLRNPYTFAFQPGTGRMFINDVGQTTWEEINDGIVGSNYGWSVCEGFCMPTNPTYRDPLLEYPHSGDPTASGCAIVGGAFYNPAVNQFPDSYVGKYFFADLCGGWIRLMNPANNTSTLFARNIASPVDLKVGPDGALYYLAQGNGGQVFRVQFTSTLTVQGAVSRKTQGGAGTFDIDLPLSGAPGIESRSGGATDDYTIVLTFAGAGPISVTGTPQAQVISGKGTIGSAGIPNGGMVTVSGSTVTIKLTNVANAQTITVALNGVNDGVVTRSFVIPMAVLVGDVNASKLVSATDIGLVKANSGQSVTSANFRADITADGAVTATDVSFVKAQSGTVLP
jgi:glucose/arabinose dehydrogenase